jgi:large subunit ribosomal protein L35
MPKIKTHKGTKKRVRLTKTGKIVRRHASGIHFLEKKRAARKRQFSGIETLSGKQVKTIKRNLGV